MAREEGEWKTAERRRFVVLLLSTDAPEAVSLVQTSSIVEKSMKGTNAAESQTDGQIKKVEEEVAEPDLEMAKTLAAVKNLTVSEESTPRKPVQKTAVAKTIVSKPGKADCCDAVGPHICTRNPPTAGSSTTRCLCCGASTRTSWTSSSRRWTRTSTVAMSLRRISGSYEQIEVLRTAKSVCITTLNEAIAYLCRKVCQLHPLPGHLQLPRGAGNDHAYGKAFPLRRLWTATCPIGSHASIPCAAMTPAWTPRIPTHLVAGTC